MQATRQRHNDNPYQHTQGCSERQPLAVLRPRRMSVGFGLARNHKQIDAHSFPIGRSSAWMRCPSRRRPSGLRGPNIYPPCVLNGFNGPRPQPPRPNSAPPHGGRSPKTVPNPPVSCTPARSVTPKVKNSTFRPPRASAFAKATDTPTTRKHTESKDSSPVKTTGNVRATPQKPQKGSRQPASPCGNERRLATSSGIQRDLCRRRVATVPPHDQPDLPSPPRNSLKTQGRLLLAPTGTTPSTTNTTTSPTPNQPDHAPKPVHQRPKRGGPRDPSARSTHLTRQAREEA
jgi:hypothetical protein